MNKKYVLTNLIFAALFIVFIAIDRITKELAIKYLMKGDIEIIPNVLRLHYLENRGAAWGMFQNAFWMFFVITAIVVLFLLIFYSRMPFERNYWFLRFTIVLLLSGAIGNFIDRMQWRYVVDFIYFECINFPVFNVADCFVCISVGLLMYAMFFKYKDEDLLWKKKS